MIGALLGTFLIFCVFAGFCALVHYFSNGYSKNNAIVKVY